MQIIPSVEIRDGRCVQEFGGRADEGRVVSDDPLGVVRRWVSQGAGYLHVVDLDGVRAGEPRNAELVEGISGLGVAFEVGGGIRSLADAAAYLELGARRVVIGTSAVEDPELVSDLVRRWGAHRIAVGLDGLDGRVVIRGWSETSDLPVEDLALEMEARGVRRVVYTDVARNGTLGGPDADDVASIIGLTGLSVVAAGGISSMEQIRTLRSIGCDGAIIGRALHEGKLSLPETIAEAREAVA